MEGENDIRKERIDENFSAKKLDNKRLIEAALFISARAFSTEELMKLTGLGGAGFVKDIIEELRKEYAERGSAVEIAELDGKYYMKVRNDYVDTVKQFAQESELSRGALRSLAYIAKHDGILKSEMVKKIGTTVYEEVRELIENGFIRSEKAGRSSRLFLTDKFRQYFS